MPGITPNTHSPKKSPALCDALAVTSATDSKSATDGYNGRAPDNSDTAEPAFSDDNVLKGLDAEIAHKLSHNPIARAFNYVIPHGGLLSGMFNMASLTLGAGIISIPSAFNTSGVIMACVYLVIVTGLTIYSITLLGIAMEKTGLRSFEAMARGLFGRGGDIFVALLMWLVYFGGAVGYVISVGDVLTPIFNHDGVPAFLKTDQGRRVIMSALWLLLMFPLVLPKQVNSLRYASTLGVVFIILFVICIVVHSAQNGLQNGGVNDIILFRSGNRAISGLSLFMFAYLCQANVFKIYYEMRVPSVRGLTTQALLSCGICGTLYFFAGFFGYCDFGSTLKGSILKYYDPYAQPVFFVCYIGLIVKLCAGFSLNMLACRTALFQVMRWEVETMPYWKHTIFATAFAVGALILGLFVPDVNIVFGLAGALCGGFIGFVFPSLFVMYSGNWSWKEVGPWHYIGTYFLFISGVIVIVWGSSSSIFDAVIKYS